MAAPISFSGQGNGLAVDFTSTTGAATSLPANGSSLYIVNASSNTAFFALGGSTVGASAPTTNALGTSSTAILGRSAGTFTRSPFQHTHLSAISDGGAGGRLYVYAGEGQ